jgi:UDP-glucuronate 4-epimerase
VEAGRRVVCLDNFDDFYDPERKRQNIAGALERGAELVEGDIRDADLCLSVCREREVDSVVHLAARAGVRPSIEQPALYEQVNVGGTVNLLEAARRCPGVDRFIFGSSSSVYGVNRDVPFSEGDPVGQPISPYAATKRAGELQCHVYHHLYDLPVVCLRFFTVYGPRQRPDLAIHKFARLIEAGEPLPMYGDGTSRRDYTYVGDAAAGVLAALKRAPDLGWEIINLGSSAPVELRELIAEIGRCMGAEPQIERLPEQPGDVPVTYADVRKAGRLLGWAPEVPLGRGMARFVEWMRCQG